MMCEQCNRWSSRPLVLLIAEDRSVYETVSAMLRPLQADVLEANSGEQALECIRLTKPHLILLDEHSERGAALPVLSLLHTPDAAASIPVILMAKTAEGGAAAENLVAGAADCIRKPLCALELRARIRSVMERRRLTVQLHQLGLQDPLTGLPNRAAIRSRVQDAIEAHSGSGSFALMLLDCDHFKLVNDSLGHAEGDMLLQEIAHRLAETLRRMERGGGIGTFSLARLGGDEFVILLHNLTSPQMASDLSETILTALAERYDLPSHVLCSTASIGLVISDGAHGTSDDMLRDADAALREAKAGGKGRCVTFDDAMRTRVNTRLRILKELRQAIANDGLYVEYQPIVNLDSGRAVGLEALLRWQHPELGRIPPADFIPIAEETGQAVSIGEWVISQACKQWSVLRDALGANVAPRMHVNASRDHVILTDATDAIMRAMRANEIPPECLHLEVAECQIMRDPVAATEALGTLRRIGVAIDIDDFGTGYSSLSCLHELPFDALKIGRSFVANIHRGRDYAALVHAICTLARNLGLEVIADGVENSDQVAALQSLECGCAQGLYFSHPLRADELEAYLRDNFGGGSLAA